MYKVIFMAFIGVAALVGCASDDAEVISASPPGGSPTGLSVEERAVIMTMEDEYGDVGLSDSEWSDVIEMTCDLLREADHSPEVLSAATLMMVDSGDLSEDEALLVMGLAGAVDGAGAC